ncbi:uncharacterized protein LOC120658423 [Panicum virgatum]|uniref:uncharacterized protein LOC120658423 n=1 Tax=Panicum virgatum TaxID=38727 RepID=UPI0019D5B02F|nr:uncharacterized protein LOC120658423 [Panicum virgatum]
MLTAGARARSYHGEQPSKTARGELRFVAPRVSEGISSISSALVKPIRRPRLQQTGCFSYFWPIRSRPFELVVQSTVDGSAPPSSRWSPRFLRLPCQSRIPSGLRPPSALYSFTAKSAARNSSSIGAIAVLPSAGPASSGDPARIHIRTGNVTGDHKVRCYIHGDVDGPSCDDVSVLLPGVSRCERARCHPPLRHSLVDSLLLYQSIS